MNRLQRLLPFVTLIALAIALTIATPHFFTAINLASVARQTAVINLMALGMTLVIITGGIDLSVGSTLALAGLFGTLAIKAGVPIPLSILIGVGVGIPLRVSQRRDDHAVEDQSLYRDVGNA